MPAAPIPNDITSRANEEDALHAGPPGDQRITDAEHELGLTFPAEYRSYLQAYGASVYNGLEIYGLPPPANQDDSPLWQDVVLATQRWRKGGSNYYPVELIPITSDGGELHFLIVASPFRDCTQGSVVVVSPDHDFVPLAETFFSFLRRAFEEGLQPMVDGPVR
jgi:hypothetical protein